MEDFKKDMKQNFLDFKISSGQPSETFSLPPANSIHEEQVGNCLFLTLGTKPLNCTFDIYT